jgi:hypothetical protein
MSFSQLHYTSCESGLGNYSGFQFCAVTPSVSSEIMREVERLTIYELPLGWREAEAEAHSPVNLLHTFSDNSGARIIARVAFSGRDFSNRPGNYFAHSLVASEPGLDLEHLLPIELWDAPFWASRLDGVGDLPPLTIPLRPGPITRELIAGLLTADARATDRAVALLTAADQALHTDHKVLLVGVDTTAVCHWIAAASYLLGPWFGSRLTFSTYSYDPLRCHTHVVGTIADARELAADTTTGVSTAFRAFRVFNVVTDELPDDLPVSAAAQLLVRLGVLASAPVWELALSLIGRPGDSIDAMLPALAGAALVLRHRLTTGELSAAIRLLADSRAPLTGDQVEAAVEAVIEHSPVDLPVPVQERLVALASRAGKPAISTDLSLADRVEWTIVDAALHRVDVGESPGRGLRLRTTPGRRLAAAGVPPRLLSSELSLAIELLQWAHDLGISLTDDVLMTTGSNVIVPQVLRAPPPAALESVAALWPALRAGLVAGIADLPAAGRMKMVRGPLASMLSPEDFTSHPGVGEEWLIAAVGLGRMSRSDALVYAAWLRGTGTDGPGIDDHLVKRIWGSDEWTLAEGTALMRELPPGELASEAIFGHFVAVLHDVSPDSIEEWMSLLDQLVRQPPEVVGDHKAFVAELAAACGLIRIANGPGGAAQQGNIRRVVWELVRRYPGQSTPHRMLLNQQVPPLLLGQKDPYQLLVDCPRELFDAFCGYTREALARRQVPIAMVARLFFAMEELKITKPRYGALIEERVMAPELPKWKKQEIRALSTTIDEMAPRYTKIFDLFIWKNTTRRGGSFLGRRRRPPKRDLRWVTSPRSSVLSC